jgi:hypothetical protein
MPLAGVLGRRPEPCPVEGRWWLDPPAAHRAIERQGSPLQAPACFRLGDAVLELTADDPGLLDTFRRLYGDCAVSPPAAALQPLVRCAVRHDRHSPLVLLTFEGGAPADLAAAALNLLHPPLGAPPYGVWDASPPGWHLAGGADAPVLAACGSRVLVDSGRVLPDFLIEYLVSTTLAAQPELLVLHGASLRLGEAGLLLTGPSHAGKTTTALHLAARGHMLFGDEVAVVRLASRELLPLRRTVNLRSGPRTPELAAAVGRLAARDEPPVVAHWSRPCRIGELFADGPVHPVGLRAVFFLRGFADRASLTPFRLTLHDVETFETLSNDIAYASWGLTPERRTLRVLTVRQLLARLPCWLLKIGPPSETAELIEHTMEELGC